MPVWKQLAISFAVLFVGLCSLVYFSPGAGQALVSMGVPASAVALISGAPEGDEQAPRGQGQGGQQAQSGGQGQGQGGGQGQGNRRGGGNQAILVATQPVAMGVVNDRLSAIGDGEAIEAVTVMPQASGTLDQILVSSGQKVSKGDLIARLDREEQVILRDQAAVALRSAKEKAESYRNLQSFSRLDVLDAQIAEEQAQLQLTTAELNLKRRDIVAPIDGVIGIVGVSVGDNVTNTTAIVSLDNRSQLLVDFWAPERFVAAVRPGMPVEAKSVSRPGQVFQGTVEAVDSRVDQASRTIRIRAKIDNPDDVLRAGMSFAVAMRFPGDSYAAVNPLAVQWDGEGSFVWQIVDNKSVKTRVTIVQRNSDQILVEAPLKEGDVVAVEGLQRVREGGTVEIAGETRADAEEVAVR
ncbi:MAG: efflux RND transporter periplasmic adaptor subunit [Alphaproteobacteria bacterium]|nr:efflux RND transporter periplasmic adaptor subunit [Alphaproteobacteria bacterium]MBU0831852.1 efflux RND transporter periplasmic adaptor subunit [Alphaproteobacteria bacterium]MBU1765821.1 efflux RND transporter periplasmic adaptor subunit [Alphaproteobacteria bacterium]MDM7980059.1 efflux RND transporter periplasmic adaptor subunit [Rhizobium sp.]MDM8013045.1 efflux RND transporter periplasmic adaptor subunit [Rhizobium sp.]